MPPSPQLDEFAQAELDARVRAAREGFALGVAPDSDTLSRLSVMEP